MSSPDSSAPRADQRTRQVFDDVIERRVVQSLIHDLRSPMGVLGGYFASDGQAESREVRDRAHAAFEQSNRLLDEFTAIYSLASVVTETSGVQNR